MLSTFSGEGYPGVGINPDFNLLPRSNIGQLTFLVIGRNPGSVQGNKSQKRLAGLNVCFPFPQYFFVMNPSAGA